MKVLFEVKHSTPNDLDDLKLKYPNLFSGKLGCARDMKIKLDIDTSVKPVRQPQRPIAIHLRDVVEKELLKQEVAGVIERVEAHHGLTPWVSNLVVVSKGKPVNSKCGSSTLQSSDSKELEVRLTCDSRELNKAIKRTRYPTKTLEDIVYLVNGSKIFSKLDIVKAFHQLELDEESRNLST